MLLPLNHHDGKERIAQKEELHPTLNRVHNMKTLSQAYQMCTDTLRQIVREHQSRLGIYKHRRFTYRQLEIIQEILGPPYANG